MMEKIQRFGSAMLAPVLLFAFAGLAVGIGTVATLPNIVGDLANEDTFWYQAWTVWLDGAWTVFRQIELLFVLGLPIALAKTAKILNDSVPSSINSLFSAKILHKNIIKEDEIEKCVLEWIER